jgi:hypothetical protein
MMQTMNQLVDSTLSDWRKMIATKMKMKKSKMVLWGLASTDHKYHIACRQSPCRIHHLCSMMMTMMTMMQMGQSLISRMQMVD